MLNLTESKQVPDRLADQAPEQTAGLSQEPCGHKALKNPHRLRHFLSERVTGKPVNVLLNTGCKSVSESFANDLARRLGTRFIAELAVPGDQARNSH